MQKEENGRRRRRAIYLWILLMLSILLVAASYTWFSISRRPRVSDMKLYVNAPVGLELAPAYNSEEWVQQLNFNELVEETSILKPVTWSQEKNKLMAISYGLDGRMTDQWQELSDEQNANKKSSDGYYTMCTVYARSDEPMNVSLSPAVQLSDGSAGAGTYVVGTPEWDGNTVRHEDGGSGAQYAIRVGLRITPVDPATGQATGQPEFFIYEPNCDQHVVQAGQSSAETGYVATQSIDGTDSLIDDAHLIRQTTSTWTEADPVQRTVVMYQLGEFLTDTRLFSLQQNGMVRMDVYLWLEGQDVDCTNVIGDAAKIFASIQLQGDAGHGGLVEIP